MNKDKIFNKKNRYNRKRRKAKTKMKNFIRVNKILPSIIQAMTKEVTKKIRSAQKSQF
jgi:hypothetical protein